MGIEAFLKKASDLNYEGLVSEIWNLPSIQAKVKALNTTGQLFKGLDADGKEFPYYSETSQSVYGKPNAPIKLFDTGDFYDSFRIVVRGLAIEIEANPYKEGINLEDKYKEYDLYGLNDESKEQLIKDIEIEVENFLKRRLQVD